MNILPKHNSEMKKFLFLGGSSIIGSKVQNYFQSAFPEKEFLTGTRQPINKRDFYFDLNSHYSIPEGPGHAFIFSFSKLNNLDQKEIAKNYETNVLRTIDLIEMLISKKWRIIYISSDAVDNYRSTNTSLSLINIYGHQKHLLEKFITTNSLTSKVIRVSKVFDQGSTLLMNWLTQLKVGKQIDAFSNYFFSPITNSFLTSSIMDITINKHHQVFTISGKNYLSYSDFFQLVQVNNPNILNFSLVNIKESPKSAIFNKLNNDIFELEVRYEQDISEVIDQFVFNYKNHKPAHI